MYLLFLFYFAYIYIYLTTRENIADRKNLYHTRDTTKSGIWESNKYKLHCFKQAFDYLWFTSQFKYNYTYKANSTKTENKDKYSIESEIISVCVMLSNFRDNKYYVCGFIVGFGVWQHSFHGCHIPFWWRKHLKNFSGRNMKFVIYGYMYITTLV